MFNKKIITRTVLLLSLVSLFNDISSELLYPVLPVYLKSIGFSFFLIGILEGIAEGAAGISKGYFGNLSDSIGKRLPFVQIGYAFSAVAKAMLAIFSNVFPVFIARTCDKLGKGVRTSARDAMLSVEAADGSKAAVFGFNKSMDTIGAAIGPMLALMYLYFYPGNYKTLFAIAIIPSVIAVLITFVVKEKRNSNQISKSGINFFSFFKYWNQADEKFKTIVSGLLLFTFMNSSDVFLLLSIKNKEFSDQIMIGCYIFYNLVFALFAFPIGHWSDKSGMMKTIIIGLLIFSAVYFSIGFADSLFYFALIFFAYGIYAACFEATVKAIISSHCKKEETGTAFGFYNSCASIMTILASTWTGFVWMKFGATTAFVISASGVLLVVIYFLIKKLERG